MRGFNVLVAKIASGAEIEKEAGIVKLLTC